MAHLMEGRGQKAVDAVTVQVRHLKGTTSKPSGHGVLHSSTTPRSDASVAHLPSAFRLCHTQPLRQTFSTVPYHATVQTHLCNSAVPRLGLIFPYRYNKLKGRYR